MEGGAATRCLIRTGRGKAGVGGSKSAVIYSGLLSPRAGFLSRAKGTGQGRGRGRPPKPQHPKRQQLGPVDDGFFYVRTYVRGRPGALTSHRIDVIPDATLPYRSYVFIIPYRQLVTPVALPLPSPSPFIRYTVLLGVVPPYIYIYIHSFKYFSLSKLIDRERIGWRCKIIRLD